MRRHSKETKRPSEASLFTAVYSNVFHFIRFDLSHRKQKFIFYL